MIIQNKKAFFDYSIEEQYEAGIILQGWEVKSIVKGKAQLVGGYVNIADNKISLNGLSVTPIKEEYSGDMLRTKELLLNKQEIKKLIGKVQQKGYTLVALNLHFKNGKMKCQIGLAKGKTKFDKRESEKQKDIEKEVRNSMKNKSKNLD